MMVMADSAAARMTSCVVDSVKVVLEMEGSWVIFIIEVMPALTQAVSLDVVVGEKGEEKGTRQASWNGTRQASY
jgi:hypothetical protein